MWGKSQVPDPQREQAACPRPNLQSSLLSPIDKVLKKAKNQFQKMEKANENQKAPR